MTKVDIKNLEAKLTDNARGRAAAEKRLQEALARIEVLDKEADQLRTDLSTAKAAYRKARKELKTIGDFTQDGGKLGVTFWGWDGRSYNGEGTTLRTWTNPNHPGEIFVKTSHYGGTFHKVTGETHPTTGLPSVNYFCEIKSPPND